MSTGLKTSATSEYIPPVVRPQCDLTLEQAIQTIPFHKFQFNPQYADKDPYILISSGSFSPITILHTQLLTMIRDYIMITKGNGHVLGALLSPVHDNYGKPSLIHQNHRIKMCELATDDFNWIGTSTIETGQSKWVETRLIFDQLNDAIQSVFNNYTIQVTNPTTINNNNNENTTPTTTTTIKLNPRLVFCMGSDVFIGFRHESWWSYDDVKQFCSTYRLAIILRENDAKLVDEILQTHPIVSLYRDSIWIIPPSYSNTISSTLIRKQLSIGGSIHGLVHPKVEQYILDNQLYKSIDSNSQQVCKPNPSPNNYIPLFQQQQPTVTNTTLTLQTQSPIHLEFSNTNTTLLSLTNGEEIKQQSGVVVIQQ